MSQIFESLKALISPEMISKASAFLGERDSKVSSAASSILPGVLGSLLKKGDSNQVRETLEDAGRSNVLSDISRIFSGNMTEEQQCVGDRFVQSVMGGKVNDFTSAVAADSGISAMNASKLTTMISAVVSGFLGNKMVNNNMSLSGLLGDLGKEKASFLGMIPSRLADTLGLQSMVGTKADNRAYASGISNNNRVDNPKKKGMGWLTWLIIIVLLLLLFFWWRSCRRNNVTTDRIVDRTTVMADTATNRVTRTANELRDDMRVNDRDWTDLELPNGVKIRAYRDGAEEDILDYLKSNKYKNASAEDLNKKWFGFDNIRFKLGSTNELMDGSHPQMDNVASILKYYDDTRVVIGGFADVTGSEAVNDEISKERADYIKSLLVQKGVSSSRITTEGYGEEFAKHSANDSDRARSEDRTIAMRFRK